ncbi:unnamed protein product [Trichogramma brassicae]|uniref:Uncharacterized protein n=1 Tax=Trichogramma brassicae TaxID=86971 RepID=A0A6H5HU07_9HYME|nr:unnamed protein product [Trichogramma brassicae]
MIRISNSRRKMHTQPTHTKQNHSELTHELSRREPSTHRPQSINIDWRARRTSDDKYTRLARSEKQLTLTNKIS